LGRPPKFLLHPPFMGRLYGAIYYKLELGAIARVEKYLEATEIEGTPLTFRSYDFRGYCWSYS